MRVWIHFFKQLCMTIKHVYYATVKYVYTASKLDKYKNIKLGITINKPKEHIRGHLDEWMKIFISTTTKQNKEKGGKTCLTKMIKISILVHVIRVINKNQEISAVAIKVEFNEGRLLDDSNFNYRSTYTPLLWRSTTWFPVRRCCFLGACSPVPLVTSPKPGLVQDIGRGKGANSAETTSPLTDDKWNSGLITLLFMSVTFIRHLYFSGYFSYGKLLFFYISWKNEET